MSTRTAAAGVVLALIALGTAAWAGDRDQTRRAPGEPAEQDTAPAFTASGEFSGALEGNIRIGDDMFEISPQVQIYEIGRGLLEPGTEIENRLVFVSGETTGGAQWIDVIIVRPVGEILEGEMDEGAVSEKGPSAPR